MPFSKAMQNAVLQTVFLHTVQMIISHHLWSSTEEIFTNNDLYYQLSNATEFFNNATISAKMNGTSLPSAIDPSTLDNSTAINGTSVNGTSVNGTSVTSNSDETSFYKHDLPRDIAIVFILTFLDYFWQIWLEKILPARSRPSITIPEKDLPEDDDAREDAIVKKWIAQGKVRRASLSFWNTFLKWIMDMSLGSLWLMCVSYVLEELFKWKSGKMFKTKNKKLELGLRYLFSFMDVRPLASLIAFAVVPAQKRIVAVAGMQLAASTFFGFFANTLIPWLLKREFVKDMVGNMSEGIRNGTQVSPFGPPPPVRLSDEL